MVAEVETETLIYYRPDHGDGELLTSKDVKRMQRLWGKQPYNRIEAVPQDHNFGTGIHKVTELLFTIQNDFKLNARETALRERISKGLTFSQGRNAQYGSTSLYVEQNMAWELICDAIDLFNKECETRINSYSVPVREVYRLFNLPYPSIMDKVKEQEENVINISKPERTHSFINSLNGNGGDQQSSYKFYHIKGELTYKAAWDRDFVKKIYQKFPYLGKLHQSSLLKGYIQIYVYDFKNRDWAVQNVMDYLIRSHNISLAKK